MPDATLTASYQAYSFTTYWNRWFCRPGKRKRHPAFRRLFGNTLVLDTLRLQRLGAQRAFLVLFVFGKVAFEEFHLTFILIIQNVGGDTVKEPTVVRDNHRAARELQQGVFQRAQGFDIQVVRRFVEQQDVTAHLQQLRQMQTTALTAGQFANAFALIDAFEVEAAYIGAAWHFSVADLHDIQPAGHFFPDGFAVVHRVAELIDRGQLDGFTQRNGAAIRLLLTGHHAEQGRFTRAVWPDDPDDSAFRYREAQVIDQYAVAVGFTQVADFNDFVAQTRSWWNKQFVGFVTFLILNAVQFFKASQTRLTFRLTAFRALTHPLQLFLNGFTARRFGRR